MNIKTGILMAAALSFASTAALAQTSDKQMTGQSEPAMKEQTEPMVKPLPGSQDGPSSAPSMKDETSDQTSSDQADVSQPAKLVGLPIFSSKDEKIGEVTKVERDSLSNETSIYTDVGGFLGLGEKTVKISDDLYEVEDKQIRLKITTEEVESLPAAEEAEK